MLLLYLIANLSAHLESCCRSFAAGTGLVGVGEGVVLPLMAGTCKRTLEAAGLGTADDHRRPLKRKLYIFS